MRALVKKYLPVFQGYVQEHGPTLVKEVLTKGKCKSGRITCGLNKKDRHEMIKVLGLN